MATAVEQPVESAPGLTWESFAQTPEWKHLTKRQRVWFIWRCATGDSVAATRMAFEVEPKNLRALAWGTERNKYVKAALDLWKNRSEREAFLEQLKAEIDCGEEGSVARSRNMALYARLKFGLETPDVPAEESGKPPAEVQRFKVGDVVTQKGIRYRTTKVSAEGKVLEAEEIA